MGLPKFLNKKLNIKITFVAGVRQVKKKIVNSNLTNRGLLSVEIYTYVVPNFPNITDWVPSIYPSSG